MSEVSIDKFDPNMSSNPFAYFTQIIYYAFVRRITKEKKQQMIKEKLLKESNIEQRIALQAHEESGDYQQIFVDMLDKYQIHHDDDWMKVGIITDTHYGGKNDNLQFAAFQRKFYEGTFFPILRREGITTIIH